MSFFEFRKANHLAILGFLCPFLAAGITAALLLGAGPGVQANVYSPWYLVVNPVILVAGIVLSLRSIKRIETLGDRDYAYSGLVLNLLFLTFYLISIAISLFA
ncbi:MAG: hypothetical protein P8165_08575 [Deltaproteobacteria bacterium]|jgi:hypothetical protein